MVFSKALEALPPVPDGFKRVLRVESKGSNKYEGNIYVMHRAGHNWNSLPCPEYDTPAVYIEKPQVCAATADQFHDWWPEECLQFLADYEKQVVVLDVPDAYITITRRQAVLLRSAAVTVAILQ